jgi:hypothetical protein
VLGFIQNSRWVWNFGLPITHQARTDQLQHQTQVSTDGPDDSNLAVSALPSVENERHFANTVTVAVSAEEYLCGGNKTITCESQLPCSFSAVGTEDAGISVKLQRT